MERGGPAHLPAHGAAVERRGVRGRGARLPGPDVGGGGGSRRGGRSAVGVGGLLQLLEVVLAQIIDDDAHRTGHRREGAYFGVNGFVVRGSVVLQAIVAAAVLTATGFDAGLGDAQLEAVDGGIRLMLAVIPLGFTAVGWLCFWLYPIRTRDL
ncbi:MFS transporter [Microbacterium sp. NRRL B-14842]|uniref:MFS transporter n=1 Tax=Microbacterium sp. NRRL B-14842 TaxID=3162881 RepID=UPI003D2A6F61